MRLRIPVSISLLSSCALFSQTYTISSVAGSSPQVNIPATTATLGGRVLGVAADAFGNVYFSAQDSIMQVSGATGILTFVTGNGISGFSGDNGPAANAQVSDPQGLAIDSSGNLYIADNTNHRIRKISGGTITTVAGNGTAGFSGDNGPATAAELDDPLGIAVDSAGNLYIADSGNNRIRKVSGGTITTIAGNGTAGFTGDNSGNGATSAELNDPTGVAVDASGNVYIADYGNNRIRKVSGGIISTVAGNGTGAFTGDNGQAATAGVNEPRGVAVDTSGNVYIADAHNYRVRKVTASTGVITTVAGNGTAGFSGDNGLATSAELRYPAGVSLDSSGNLYIADLGDSVIRKVSGGTITTVAGTGSAPFAGDTGLASNALLDDPTGVALDSSGNIYIADLLNGRIREVSPLFTIDTLAGDSINGLSGDNGPALNAELDDPVGVAVDSAGNVYISDQLNNRIRKVSNGTITTFAGNGTAGYVDNVALASAEFNTPYGIAIDSSNNLYIVDRGNNRIREISNGIINTIAGNGTPGFTGDNGPALSAELNTPGAVAVDALGNVYFSDTANHRVRKISGGTITTIAGTGKAGYSGDRGPATSAQLNNPVGVAVDAANNIYIADRSNFVIRKISNGVITTIAGSGTAGLSGDGGAADSADLNNPFGVAVGSNGNVYIADSSNNRVRLLTPVAGTTCSYSISPVSAQVPAAGGNVSISISTAPACAWTVTGLPTWITIPGASSGSGSGTISLSVAPNSSASSLSVTITVAGVSLTITVAASTTSTAPVITSVTTASGGPNIAQNTFIVIKGTNLVPAGTPSSGVIWSTAPSFLTGQMPTQLGNISVRVNNSLAYIYFYCSAATDPSCASDQINALTPLDNTIGSVPIVVVNSTTSSSATLSAPYSANLVADSPAFLLFGASNYVAATHLNYNLIGPTNLYPGSSTPAQPGEEIVIYAVGFGLPSTPLTPGSATQSGSLPSFPVCAVGNNAASVAFAGLISPGLYQLNITIPAGLSAGDQPITCVYNGTSTPAGDLITVN